MGWWDELESMIMDTNNRPVSKEALIEHFSEIFHEYWMEMTMGLCHAGKADYHACQEWRQQWKPFFDLTEAQKEIGRTWGKRIVRVLEDRGVL